MLPFVPGIAARICKHINDGGTPEGIRRIFDKPSPRHPALLVFSSRVRRFLPGRAIKEKVKITSPCFLRVDFVPAQLLL
jgi:hypothetical protein